MNKALDLARLLEHLPDDEMIEQCIANADVVAFNNDGFDGVCRALFLDGSFLTIKTDAETFNGIIGKHGMVPVHIQIGLLEPYYLAIEPATNGMHFAYAPPSTLAKFQWQNIGGTWWHGISSESVPDETTMQEFVDAQKRDRK